LLYFVHTYRDKKLSVSLCVFRAPLQPDRGLTVLIQEEESSKRLVYR
jgi:hypothetical protein